MKNRKRIYSLGSHEVSFNSWVSFTLFGSVKKINIYSSVTFPKIEHRCENYHRRLNWPRCPSFFYPVISNHRDSLRILKNAEIAINQDPVIRTLVKPFRWVYKCALALETTKCISPMQTTLPLLAGLVVQWYSPCSILGFNNMALFSLTVSCGKVRLLIGNKPCDCPDIN